MKDDQYILILSGYTKSLFRNFESYLRTEVHLVEHDIRLVLDEYNSSFFTYNISPVIYTFKEKNNNTLIQNQQPNVDKINNNNDNNPNVSTYENHAYVVIAPRNVEKTYFTLNVLEKIGNKRPTHIFNQITQSISKL